jgi:hypothetical protein
MATAAHLNYSEEFTSLFDKSASIIWSISERDAATLRGVRILGIMLCITAVLTFHLIGPVIY